MAPPPRHRPAADGGYQRGEETRAKIVEAALGLFGEKGFEGASTREIAERAGVNAPALVYYFDNKEGVYLACVEHIMGRVSAYMSGAVDAAQALLDEPAAGDAALIHAFCSIQTQIAEFLLMSGEPDSWRLFMAREQAGLGHESSFMVMKKQFSEQLRRVNAELVSRLMGLPPDDPEVVVRMLAITGQLFPFHMTCRSAGEALGWEKFDRERLNTVVRIINEQTVSLLIGMTEMRTMRMAEQAALEAQYPAAQLGQSGKPMPPGVH
ncbi:CerR family C-terminal domain-containing protein [Paraburkholderia sp.]|uniref:CerR family C-terminal domain-containing protein n=1 Tax=Paraburkholderia sp. TaxID=1926495 RepID=UPI0023893B6D|nr:CerR family C-terminal domain-containing protein [Paraburkholderia sp.]MDE1181839.1 CerR family C-terminal domain-containing protein [Paraburkholderia sp.]